MAPRTLVHNVTSTCNLGRRLNLHYIAKHGYNVEYDPKKSPYLTMRLKKPRCTAWIFASGKMVVTGAIDEQTSRVAARRFARIVQKLGFPVKFLNFRITNILATCTLPFQLPPFDKNFLPAEKMKSVEYEPELFPGLVYRTDDATFVVYRSGKIVIIAATSTQQLNDACSAFENSFVNRD